MPGMSAHPVHRRIFKRLREFHRREGAFTALAFALIFGLGLVHTMGTSSALPPSVETAYVSLFSAHVPGNTFVVARVVDGDTIVLDNGEYVRYIGIDTPEIFPSAECFAQQATQRNRELVEGKAVRLVRDVSNRDPYHRWLRYVFVGDTNINVQLVEEGFAKAAIYPPDTAQQTNLQLAELNAQTEEAGLWSACQ